MGLEVVGVDRAEGAHDGHLNEERVKMTLRRSRRRRRRMVEGEEGGEDIFDFDSVLVCTVPA